ncbi:CRAL/TRIO domain-containing protein [Lindgomyces ingoldianus]|uniref:CRAL/TRIO domain-containing protein n=1 Tax=Lindgomyces ingoldianus TaxID=673940 RepID=A0ACB6QHX0_9PLEO|nr:CRAL/TRIO domain-containing protein [Lindgomyces ingoldianus]KAF2466485.1 CRAL/TRIO domain-containing protein [Lindgomyces ingoldianus]
MSQNDLTRIESFQYPAAHYGHLSDNQQAALDVFKQQCLDEGYYKPAGTNKKTDPSHDDETLLRYLRARRFNHQEAFKQFKDTEDWRVENNVVDLYDSIEAEEYEQTRRLYPQWTGRRDKRGIPVFLYEVAPLNTKAISGYEKMVAESSLKIPAKVAPKLLRLVALYESLTRFVMPLCSAVTDRKHPETPISQSNNIVDISKVGLKQFWNLKNHMQDASQLATAHYPETLDRIFIIGAPVFFPTVWGWIKRWFDPITVSKIFILSPSNVFPTLSQYIDPDNIPKKYGGNLDFEFGMMPVLEPAIQASLRWESPATQNGENTWPIGPIKWEESHDGSVKAVAVGHEKGKPRRRTVCRLETPVSIKAMHGLATVNTPIDELELALTTVGTATQPLDLDDTNIDIATPPTDTPTPAATPKPELQDPASTLATPVSNSKVEEGKDSTNVPISDASSEHHTGTSDTHYEPQHQAHVTGQLTDGTPYAVINDHSDRDKTVTINPSTAGQEPKDFNIPPEETPAPEFIDQAKQAVDKVTVAAISTVGSGASGGVKTEEMVEDPLPEKSPEE